MSVLIIGANGSMGRRYQAILGYHGHDYLCADIETPLEKIDEMAQKSSGIIIATPTQTHFKFLSAIHQFKKPVLCEKPVTKDLSELEHLIGLYKGQPLQMVMQYKHLDCGTGGDSFYDYYNHGKDGLYWDTMQIIGLAKGHVKIYEKSPIWRCQLNGKRLELSHMDEAYVQMIKTWFIEPNQDLFEIRDIHLKVSEMIENEQRS